MSTNRFPTQSQPLQSYGYQQPYQSQMQPQYQQPYQQHYYYQQQQPQIQPNSLLSSINQAIQHSIPQTQPSAQQPQQQTVYPPQGQFYPLAPNYNAYPNQSLNSTYLQPHQFQQPYSYPPTYSFQANQTQLQTHAYHHPNPNQNQNQFQYSNYNNNTNYNANTPIRNPKTYPSRQTEKFPCEQCNQMFYNLTSLSNHLRNHIKCDYENCKFEAVQHVLDLHKEDRHLIFRRSNTDATNHSKPKKLDGPPNATIQGLGYALKTQEQIDLWIQERKKKWPSNRRIAEKAELAKEKEEEKIKQREEAKALARLESEFGTKETGDNSKPHHRESVQNNKKRKYDDKKDENQKVHYAKNRKNDSSRFKSSNLLSFDRSGLFSKLIEKDVDQEVSDIFEIVNFLTSNNFLDGFQTCLTSLEVEPSIQEL